jgi:hypothetical protein
MEGNIQNQPHYNLTYQLELIYFSFYDGELLWDRTTIVIKMQYSIKLIDFCRISFAVFIMKANLSKRWYKDGHTL